jgi:hypothetical protein
MPRVRLRRALRIIGLLLVAAFVVGAGGAYPRYNRIVFGAPPLALALACFCGVALLRARDGRGDSWWRWAGISCLLLAGAVTAVWIRPSLAGAAPRTSASMARSHVLLALSRDRFRSELFDELRPVALPDCRMERVGGAHDGGYLMCGNLLGSVAAGYSYGIGPADSWGCDVARRFAVPVHQYDCFDPGRPVCPGGATVFHDECIAPRRSEDGGRVFDTLESQLARNGHAGRVVVKMDVEGAEWDSLLQAPTGVLERIDQLVIELHGVGEEKHVAVVRRLKQYFHVANVHFNNHTCLPRIDPFPAHVYEVLFVNKRIATAGAPRPWGPHPLDEPNDPKLPDCQAPASRWSFDG